MTNHGTFPKTHIQCDSGNPEKHKIMKKFSIKEKSYIYREIKAEVDLLIGFRNIQVQIRIFSISQNLPNFSLLIV